MIRSILAVFAGHAVFSASAVVIFVLAGLDPEVQPSLGIMALATGVGTLASAAGGYIAAVIARRRAVLHGFVLTAVFGFEALGSIVAQPGAETYWTQIATLAVMGPAATLGSWLCRHREPPAAS